MDAREDDEKTLVNLYWAYWLMLLRVGRKRVNEVLFSRWYTKLLNPARNMHDSLT